MRSYNELLVINAEKKIAVYGFLDPSVLQSMKNFDVLDKFHQAISISVENGNNWLVENFYKQIIPIGDYDTSCIKCERTVPPGALLTRLTDSQWSELSDNLNP